MRYISIIFLFFIGILQAQVQPDAQTAYKIGDCVTFNGLKYTSKINNNVWSPVGYPAGWQIKND